MRLSSSVGLTVTFLCIGSVVQGASYYTLTDLGLGNGSLANAINDAGQVTGGFSTSDGGSGYVYDGGAVRSFGITGAAGYGINSTGQVAGIRLLSTGRHRGFIWTEEDGLVDLPTFSGDSAYALAINDRGEAVGWAWDGDVKKAVLWSEAGEIQDLDPFGSSYAGVLDINNRSEAVGHADVPGGSRAFLYSNGRIIDIGSLYEDSLGNVAMSINDYGQIAGYSFNRSGHQAFFYENGSLTGLGTLGGTISYARAINNMGEVVGVSEITPGDHTQHAFVWSGTSMIDLNTLIDPALGWTLTDAWGLNNSGQIVGYGKLGGYTRAYLLTPVPEPGTLVLFLLATTIAVAPLQSGPNKSAGL